MKWIYVGDRTPNSARNVLIATDDFPRRVMIGYCEKTAWYAEESHEAIAVSHWMDLPLPPDRNVTQTVDATGKGL